MGLLFRSDVFDLLGWEDENDSGRFCFEFKPERLTLKSYALSIHNYGPIHTDYDTNTNTKLSIRVSAPEIQQQLKLLLGFLFPEAQNVIDTKASYGSPWRIHEGLTRKLPVTNKYVKPICIGFGEAEDHDLENLKKQLEDDDLIRGTITAEHQGSEVTKASVHSKSSRHNHSWENQGTAQHGSPLLLEILETNELEFRDINW
ncbi:BnaC02g31230D [Brassica napus]|nr:BnaC02g31230D [Brassica napus]